MRPPRGRVTPPAAATSGVAAVTGLVAETPGTLVRVPHELGPDGGRDPQADLVSSVDGTPCGQACAPRALQRWGYAPVETRVR